MDDDYWHCAGAQIAAQLPHHPGDALRLLKLVKKIYDGYGPGADPIYVVTDLRSAAAVATSQPAILGGRLYKSNLA